MATPFFSSKTALIGFSSTALFVISQGKIQAQTYHDLSFGNTVESTNGTGATLGPYYTGNTFNFTNVAPFSGNNIDMRSTATTFGNGSFFGSFPDYSSTAGEPDGDLGYVYGATGSGAGALEYQLDFYNGGGSFSDSFVINDFRLMIYDVDGETAQSESVTVSTADGFYGYRTPTSNEITVVDNGSGLFTFSGPGIDRSEDDPSAAIILFFRNTSSIKLRMDSDTTATNEGDINYVFGAIDGDLSLLGGDSTNFGGFTPIPEPSVAATMLFGLAAVTLRRRR